MSAVKIVPLRSLGRFETLKLVFRLFGFFFAMQWAQLRRRPPAEIAIQTRAFLEELGGLWIKAGQLISLRIDLLSPEMTDELSQLAYRAYGFAPEVSRQVIEESLGYPIEVVFDRFEEQPFAAASISQVHRGRLRHNGVWVAIKVQRPDIVKIFARDMKLIRWLLRQMNRVPGVSHISWDGMIRELEQIMREEVDYHYEASNLRRMRKLLREHKVYVPKLYGRFSGQKILVMEFVQGVLMSDYLKVKRDEPERLACWCAENNVRPHKIGSRLLRSFYRQLFEDNLFHGDLHPGNIILLRDNRFALIDLGTVGNLERRFVKLYQSMAQAFAMGDYAKGADAYLLMCDSIPVIDIAAYRVEMVEVARVWEARSHMKGLTFYQKSITGSLANEVGDVARKYKVNPSWQFLRVARSVSTMDANLNALLGNASPRKILRQYLRQANRRSLRRLFKGEFLTAMAGRVGEITDASNYLSDSLRRQAIQFQGVQTKTAYLLGLVFRLIRWGLVIVGLILLYDFFHLHHNNVVDGIHEELGVLSHLAEQIPPYAYEVGLAVLLLIVLLFIGARRVGRRLSTPTVRLPSGRLSNGD